MKQLLTHSAQDAFKTCRRRYWFAYVIRLRRALDAKALRMGIAWHLAREALMTTNLEAAVGAIRTEYGFCPEEYDQYDWDIERETLIRLVCGYHWRWQTDTLRHVATEQPFVLPLRNPETGGRSTVFDLAGKIDGIEHVLEGDRLAVAEAKFLGEDIGPDATLWKRLRVDAQISTYMIAARELGHDVSTVMYDVVRKPTIRPESIPYTDDNGFKIVTDSDNMRVFNANGKPRQTGDKKKGWTLQTRQMLPDEWGEKLNADIAVRPDYYYARVEIPRLDDELDECRREWWEIQQAIREAQRTNRWYRTCNRNTCPFCPYFDLCTSKWNPAVDPVPEGFQIIDNPHPELGDTSNAAVSTPSSATESSTESSTETAAV